MNPIKDGLNLVAKEGPMVNERDGVLCLSPGAGAWDELGSAALAVHPFDLEQTAAALHTALEMPATERAERRSAPHARGGTDPGCMVRRSAQGCGGSLIPPLVRSGCELAQHLGEPDGPVDDDIGTFEQLRRGFVRSDRDLDRTNSGVTSWLRATLQRGEGGEVATVIAREHDHWDVWANESVERRAFVERDRRPELTRQPAREHLEPVAAGQRPERLKRGLGSGELRQCTVKAMAPLRSMRSDGHIRSTSSAPAATSASCSAARGSTQTSPFSRRSSP